MGMTLECWNTIAAWVTAIATLGLVVGAFIAWRVASSTLVQMKKDSKAQARPYVHVWIVPSIGGKHSWDLLVKNTGRSTARNLKMSADVWPENDALVDALRNFFNAGQSLPPNSTIRTYWCLGERNHPLSTGATGFDIATTVHLTYEGIEPEDKFTESFRLDPKSLGMTPLGFSGEELKQPYTKADRKLSEIVTALNNMRREISDS